MKKPSVLLRITTALCALCFGSSLCWAVVLTDLQFDALKMSALVQFELLEREATQTLTLESEQGVRVEPGITRKILPGDVAVRLFKTIQSESDPALREVLIDAWLTSRIQGNQLSSADTQALETIRTMPPVILIPHHEMTHHNMPALNLAKRAENLLLLQQRQRTAVQLRANLEQLIEAYGSAPNSETFKAAHLASSRLSSSDTSRLVKHFLSNLQEQPQNARALLSLADPNEVNLNVLVQIIQFGDVVSAREALRRPMQPGQTRMLVEQAFLRPEIGGIVIQKWLESGGDADERLWSLLADPYLGADAARALADHSDQLVTIVERDINAAQPTARLRMLLALKLRNSDDSIALLNTLLEAEWLSPQQQQAVASWL